MRKPMGALDTPKLGSAIGVLNDLLKNRIVENYAIGGGIALLHYLEPVLTYDLDAFVFLPSTDKKLVSLAPIYEYMKSKGYTAHQEHVLIEGVPVQFIPAYNPLIEEAVREAAEKKNFGVMTRVIRAEYLLAIMLQTNRTKDRMRMVELLEFVKIDKKRFHRILSGHGLTRSWDDFKARVLGE